MGIGPHVDPDRAAARHTSRGGDEERAAPAAHVEHFLVPAQVEPVEHALDLVQLPPPAGADHQRHRDDEHQGPEHEHRRDVANARDTRRGSPHGAHTTRQREPADGAGGIEAVVGMHPPAA